MPSIKHLKLPDSSSRTSDAPIITTESFTGTEMSPSLYWNRPVSPRSVDARHELDHYHQVLSNPATGSAPWYYQCKVPHIHIISPRLVATLKYDAKLPQRIRKAGHA
ncbi:hypothetical protein FRB98_001385, partial [Tulasnella sp. 332]